MQLKIQRTQRLGGVTGTVILFCLDVRAEYSPEEAANIAKYRLGREIIYNSKAARRHLDNMGAHLDQTQSGTAGQRVVGLAKGVGSMALAKMQLNISVASLGRGHHIECKDMAELLETEESVMDACRNLKTYLAAAATFNGSIILIDFDQNERQHISQGVLQLPSPTPSDGAAALQSSITAPESLLPQFDLARFKLLGIELAATIVLFLLFRSTILLLLGLTTAIVTAGFILARSD